MNRIAVALSLSVAAACNAPAEAPPLPPDDLPLVEGLVPAEDEDPRIGFVRYTVVAQKADVELVAGQVAHAWTYNGTVPGPLLQARVGDEITVEIKNDLDEATTIHWHGVRVPNEMDGIVEGEMLAIEPGASFTATFIARDAGTFWFHPHIRTNVQIERGLQGVLVIHEAAEDMPDVDADRAFVLDDVYLNDDGTIAPFGSGMEVMHGRFGNVLLVNGSETVPSFKFGAGRVERWRLVNTANARTMVVRFPGLAVRHVGADGGLWPQTFCKDIQELELPVGARAELEVRIADGVDVASLVSVVLALDENDDVIEIELPLAEVTRDADAPAGARPGHKKSPSFTYLDDGTPTHTLRLGGYNSNGSIVFTINGVAYPNFEDWSVTQNEPAIIEVVNDLMMEHPFHLHGQFFQVVSRTGALFDDAGWRDTTLIRSQERIRLATRFDNPGMWMYHCHILEHEENGMMGMVMVEPAADAETME